MEKAGRMNMKTQAIKITSVSGYKTKTEMCQSDIKQ